MTGCEFAEKITQLQIKVWYILNMNILTFAINSFENQMKWQRAILLDLRKEKKTRTLVDAHQHDGDDVTGKPRTKPTSLKGRRKVLNKRTLTPWIAYFLRNITFNCTA